MAPTDRLAEGIYQRVREDILRGHYRPNQRLVEVDIAAELAASRTPVREALHRLGSEGLIVRHQRAWLVREFSKVEIQQIYEIRLALEAYATRLTAERASDADLDGIGALIDDQLHAQAAAAASRQLLVSVNDRFHGTIVAACGNPRLIETIRHNQTFYFNQRIAGLYSDDQAADSLDEHVVIAAAVRRRAGEKAEALVRQHVAHALEIIMDRLT
ncbi:GntR family transcriptional regulator [Fodinicola acaciae]|uniref:GntR family transcriptional regulator n=1 Tax=Fodinicola acaciae TaxID=2681555 RepID=UPI0013D6293D|nr:GntR family transcriptional regulator [Fodinicola acaciae]